MTNAPVLMATIHNPPSVVANGTDGADAAEVLTLVARFSNPELILIVRVPPPPLAAEGYFNAPACEGASARDAASRRARRDVVANPLVFSRYRRRHASP